MINGNNFHHNNLLNKYKSRIWFSHVEYRREVKRNLIGKKEFKWTHISELWDWDNCFVSAVKKKEGKIKIIIRSSKLIYSNYRKKEVKVRYMFGFDIDHIGDLEEDEYNEPKNNHNKQQGKLRHRFVLKFDEKHCIWQWKDKEKSKENSELVKIHKELRNIQDQTYDPIKSSIFRTDAQEENSSIVPVIYQPAVNSLKNFLREVHCNRVDDKMVKVTLIFNNDHLTKHKYRDKIYGIFRSVIYHRTADIESFIINLENAIPKNFQFPGIYSGKGDMQNDIVHQDKSEISPSHQIQYFFLNEKHPIVFVNTTKHGLSFHDTNHNLWKWEYVPWEDDSPVILSNKSGD